MPNNKLILRSLISPWVSPFNDITAGSVLSWADVDNNFIYLKGELIYSALTSSSDLILKKINGNDLTVDLSEFIVEGNRWHIPSGVTVEVMENYQSFIYGDLYIEGLLKLNDGAQLVVLNGDIIISGGSISGNGTTLLIQLPEFDTTVTGATFNAITGIATFTNNSGGTFSLSGLAGSEVFVTGGTYNSSSGVATFTNNSGGTFNVSGFLTGYTNYYTTGATLVNNIAYFDRTDTLSAYTLDLSSIDFTGNTSASCISDLYLSNLHGCSPITIHDSIQSNGSTASGALSFAFGNSNIASGQNSHADGYQTTASGDFSHAEGGNTTASGYISHAEGYLTIANGQYSHAEGEDSIASNTSSHAEGKETTASGLYSHSEGYQTTANGNFGSHAEGYASTANGSYSHAEGVGTTAIGAASHAEGYQSKGVGDYSHSEGNQTTSVGENSHAEGYLTIASGQSSHAGGISSVASGLASFIHSSGSTVTGIRSVVLGGKGLTGPDNDTVYVPNLTVSTGGTTSIVNVDGKLTTQKLTITSGATNGYVLTSDASGNAVWAAPSSSSGVFGIANTSGVYTYYTTFSLAMVAAISGQTIEMFADVTESGAVSVILKNGVNINGNGHTYTLNNTGTNSCLIDNGVGVTASILNLNLRRIGATTQSNTNTTCLLVTGASKIDFNGSKAYGSNSVSVIINNSSANVSNVYAYGDTGVNAAITVYVASGKLDNSVVYNNTNNAGYYTNAILNIGTIVNCVAYTTSGAYSIYNQGEMIDCVGYSTAVTSFGGGIRNDGTAIGSTGFSSGGVGFLPYVNTFNENCNGYSSSGNGFHINGSVNCKIINCGGYSSAAYGILAYNGFVLNSVAYSSANYGLYQSNAGDGSGNISNCTIVSDSAAALFTNMNTSTSISNCTIVSRYNAASGHAVVLGTSVFGGPPGADILNNTLIVSNASANCLYAASNFTIKYASNIFKNSTTPVNANITQGVVNTSDNQGNILI